MAEIIYSKLVDGQPLDAASLNDRFTGGGGSLQGAINNLTPDATSPGTFNSNHLQSVVLGHGSLSIASETAMITIDHAVVPWPTNAVLSFLGTDLQVESPAGASYDLSTGECQGVLVMADLYVWKITDGTQADPHKFYVQDAGVFMLEVRETAGGPWVPILRTVRWVHSGYFNNNINDTPNIANREHLYKVPIRTLIRTGGDVNSFNAVRVVAGVLNDSTRTTAGTGDATVILRECQLSALLLRSART